MRSVLHLYAPSGECANNLGALANSEFRFAQGTFWSTLVPSQLATRCVTNLTPTLVLTSKRELAQGKE